MDKIYAVLGAGMQGTAAAYDLARFANPAKIIVGDASLEQAQKCALRVNELLETQICEPVQVNALASNEVCSFLEDVDVLLSCVPFWMHPRIAEIAISSGTGMVDLGGNTEITLQTLAMDALAQEAGVTLIPDCGLAPGLVNNIGFYFLENMDSVETIRLYCGVLPQHPKPPFNYMLTFNIEGLVAEYEDQAVTLQDGDIRLVNTLEELEDIHIEQLGPMEAFTTSGGSSTAPYTLKGMVQNYTYKTIRFPGHCALMKIFKDFGFWSTDEVELDGLQVKPRKLWEKLMGEGLDRYKDVDMAVVRGIATGIKDGKKGMWQVDIFDKEDPVTGFTAMERLTGFSCAIYAKEIALGLVETGCLRYEKAISSTKFLEELKKRGVEITVSKN